MSTIAMESAIHGQGIPGAIPTGITVSFPAGGRIEATMSPAMVTNWSYRKVTSMIPNGIIITAQGIRTVISRYGTFLIEGIHIMALWMSVCNTLRQEHE